MKFKSGVADKIKDNTLKAYGLTKIDTIPNIEVIVAKVPEKAKDKVIKALNRNPRIEYAEPNFIGKELIEPNDPAFTTAQWNLNPSIKFYSGESAPQIGVPAAWDISQGNSSTFVAVIDSGVYADHEDLQGKIL
ncbi:hypothetical protein HYT18_03970, partial [Candidatus Microgenomates bacterium]|nr:hypothetical protein [Candidatus Microgenomates bacterium]